MHTYVVMKLSFLVITPVRCTNILYLRHMISLTTSVEQISY